jgi:hypothetical protein
MADQFKLKAFVRIDGSGKVIPGGPIFQASKPKVGKWKQIDANLCCNPSGSTTTTTTSSTSSTSTSTSTTTTTTTASASLTIAITATPCSTPSAFLDVILIAGSDICDTGAQLQGDFTALGEEVYVLYNGFSRIFVKLSNSLLQGAGGAPGECVSCG